MKPLQTPPKPVRYRKERHGEYSVYLGKGTRIPFGNSRQAKKYFKVQLSELENKEQKQ